MSLKFALRSLKLTAGEARTVHEVASFFMLVSNTGSLRVKFAIDDDSLTDCPVGYEYREKKDDEFFDRIEFKNPNVSEITIEYIVSTGLVRSSPSITGLDDILTELEKQTAELQGISTAGTDGNEKSVGLTNSQILAANTNRKGFNLQAKSSNGGKIYLGFTNAVSTTRWFAELQAGQPCMMDDYRGPVFGISDTADQKLGWGEW